MKKFGLFVLSLASISLIWNTTQAKEYEYTNLDITANILDDGTMSVKENYTANFFVNKHGIIRDIPLNYVIEGQQFHINVLNIYVDGKKFSTSNNNGNIEIKIGDANKTLIGEQNYPISYSTYGLIRNFSGMGYAELYWNLVGYDFDTNINNVKAEIFLPKKYTGFNTNDFLITTDGSTKTVNEFGGTIDRKGGNKITITYDKGLPAYQGITLAVKFPNNYFTFDDERQAKLLGKYKNNIGDSISNFISNSLGSFLEFFGFIAIIIIAIKKFKNKDSKIDTKSGTLSGNFSKQFPTIVQYEPPKGINSAEAGLLLHREAKAKDMLSLIYKWAADGLIKLSFEEEEGGIFKKASKNVIITRIRDINPESPAYEVDFFKSLIPLFNGGTTKITASSNLYNKLCLYTLENHGKNKGWFTGGKDKGLIIIRIVVLIIFMNIFSETYPFITFLVFIAFVIYSSKAQKLKETEEGAKLISHILGYREFLVACDENKLRLFLQQDPLYFDKILPYAVAFGLDTELIKKIEPIMQEMNIKSSWYDGDINSIYIINNTISSVASHSLPPSASYSSSGGFSSGSSFGGGFSSGGGGGGGGGRSW